MKIQEIETASSRLKKCPKCNSLAGFWLEIKKEHVYVQCKDCGAEFELCEVYKLEEEREKPKKLLFFRK